MDKVYNHKDVESRIYQEWERKGYFKPEINPKGKPYCIILPPPNANGSLHAGFQQKKLFDIPSEPDPHSALNGAMTAYKLFRKLNS